MGWRARVPCLSAPCTAALTATPADCIWVPAPPATAIHALPCCRSRVRVQVQQYQVDAARQLTQLSDETQERRKRRMKLLQAASVLGSGVDGVALGLSGSGF